jgi:hypothetical protein
MFVLRPPKIPVPPSPPIATWDKFAGFTPNDIFALKYLIDVMGYTGRVEQFAKDAVEKGIPPLREQAIAYHQKKIEELQK